jgi:hypothetical protein
LAFDGMANGSWFFRAPPLFQRRVDARLEKLGFVSKLIFDVFGASAMLGGYFLSCHGGHCRWLACV